ncbi:MAG: hypothetical protein JWL62_383 [Hyphomicrobiales bacterium]|nr:hypothetical protein [Hyphomicrobiales bacterium]
MECRILTFKLPLPIASALAAFLGLSAPALAHPHVFVVVKSEVLFDGNGLVTGLRHAWTFDEMYSAFATTGINSGGQPATAAQLQRMAEQNVDELAAFGYYTVVKSPGQQIELGRAEAISMSEDDRKLVTLRFTVPLKKPASAGKALTLQVYDPTYFVSFDYAWDGVALVAAADGCTLDVSHPRALDDNESKKLTEAFFSGISPGVDFGVKLASSALVACP